MRVLKNCLYIANSKLQNMERSFLAKRMLSFAFEEKVYATISQFKQEEKQLRGLNDSMVTLENIEQVSASSFERTQVLWFFAQWCGHCRVMHEEWENAVASGKDVADWHKVDCASDGLSLARQMGVNSFPTIIYMVDGNTEKYDGERKSEHFVQKATTAHP